MQTQFFFRHMDSSQALKNYAEERLEKIKRYFSDPIKVACTLSVERIEHVAQFDVTLRNGLSLHSKEATENMYSSIDLALAKMERQVRRYKDRISSHKPHKGKATRISQEIIADTDLEQEPDRSSGEVIPLRGSDSPPAPRVVRTKELRADRLHVSQAIMQMNLLHKAFFVFTNAESGEINVVYRIDESSYGLIKTGAPEDGTE